MKEPERCVWCGAVVSIRRADYWLVEAMTPNAVRLMVKVSIRRADYWLVEGKR